MRFFQASVLGMAMLAGLVAALSDFCDGPHIQRQFSSDREQTLSTTDCDNLAHELVTNPLFPPRFIATTTSGPVSSGHCYLGCGVDAGHPPVQIGTSKLDNGKSPTLALSGGKPQYWRGAYAFLNCVKANVLGRGPAWVTVGKVEE